MTKKISVFAGWKDNKRIGTLFCDIIRGEEVFSFEYAQDWLKANPSLVLDPTLPAGRGRQYSRDKKLFGCFTDACPDRWGRLLIERGERLAAEQEGRRQRSISESDCLMKVSDYGRQGGFRFSIESALPAESIEDGKASIPPITELRKLEDACREYEKGIGKDQETLKVLIEPGSSLGGARPKANVMDENGDLWIAKFPSIKDEYDIGAWEKTMMDIASEIGISVSATRRMELSGKGSIFLTKRFDRQTVNGKTERIHFASAMTMLGERDGSGSDVGYLDIAEVILEISASPETDLRELFVRAAFDIAVSNHDNHLRNHGFLLRNEGWRLSPAYDINPVAGREDLALTIDTVNKQRSFETLLSTANFYGINDHEAENIVKETASCVSKTWKHRAKNNGIKNEEIRAMSSAFSVAEEYARNHPYIQVHNFA